MGIRMKCNCCGHVLSSDVKKCHHCGDTDPHGWVESRNKILQEFLLDLQLLGHHDIYHRALEICDAFDLAPNIVYSAKMAELTERENQLEEEYQEKNEELRNLKKLIALKIDSGA